MTNKDQNQDEFNPDNFAPIPANLIKEDEDLDYLIDASPEEMKMVYAQEEEVVDTTLSKSEIKYNSEEYDLVNFVTILHFSISLNFTLDNSLNFF